MKSGDKVVMNDNYLVSEVNRGKIWAVDGLDLVEEADNEADRCG